MNDATFMTTEEVLEYLQVTRRTIYRLIQAGRIPAVRVGHQWRFRRQDVDRWLDHQKTGSAPAEAVPSSLPPLQPAHVLIADDDEGIRDLLAKTLALMGYRIDTAADGRVALERLRAADFDLLVTDLHMPEVDGLSVVREARRLLPALKIIIITGHSTEDSAIDAVNLGVNGYLTKPFRVPDILAAAAKALGSKDLTVI